MATIGHFIGEIERSFQIQKKKKVFKRTTNHGKDRLERHTGIVNTRNKEGKMK